MRKQPIRKGTRRLAAIMFSDMVGYTALTRRDEALALQLLERHQKLLRTAFARHGGREIKSTGDGFLVEFQSALEAARCAITMQKAMRDYNGSVSAEARIQVRVGLHVGEVVERDKDILGDGVNVASRIESLADPGGVCLSQQAYDHICNKLEARIVPLGDIALRKFPFAMPLYRMELPVELETRPATDPAPAARSIAVLPFVNLSPDPKEEYLSDGITEELINALGRMESLRVVSRTSCFAYKGKAGDIRRIGEQLTVQTVLEGSLRRSGNEIRAAVRLVNVTDGFQIWAETYERRLKDLFDIQQDVAREVVRALNLAAAEGPRQDLLRPATENLAAYRLYLKGRFHWNKRSSDGMVKAIECFRKAARLDRRCALAYAGMADGYSLLAFYGGLPPRGAFAKAKAASEKAVKLNGALAETHTSLAYALLHHDWDLKGSEREFRTALRINPNYAPARLWHGIYLSICSRHAEAISEVARARELEPLSATITAAAAMSYYFARQYRQAAALFQEALEMEPDFVLAHEGLGHVYLQEGAYAKAVAHLEQALRRTDFGGSMLAAIAFAQARDGKTARADQILKRVLAMQSRGAASPVSAAIAYVGLRQPARAFHWLQRACKQRSGRLIYLKANPIFDDLRTDRRFAALARKVGLG